MDLQHRAQLALERFRSDSDFNSRVMATIDDSIAKSVLSLIEAEVNVDASRTESESQTYISELRVGAWSKIPDVLNAAYMAAAVELAGEPVSDDVAWEIRRRIVSSESHYGYTDTPMARVLMTQVNHDHRAEFAAKYFWNHLALLKVGVIGGNYAPTTRSFHGVPRFARPVHKVKVGGLVIATGVTAVVVGAASCCALEPRQGASRL